MTRWATFDCYGTLIDWNGGIRTELSRLWINRLGESYDTKPTRELPDLERLSEVLDELAAP